MVSNASILAYLRSNQAGGGIRRKDEEYFLVEDHKCCGEALQNQELGNTQWLPKTKIGSS